MKPKTMNPKSFLLFGVVFLSAALFFAGAASASEMPAVEAPVIAKTCGQSRAPSW